MSCEHTGCHPKRCRLASWEEPVVVVRQPFVPNTELIRESLKKHHDDAGSHGPMQLVRACTDIAKGTMVVICHVCGQARAKDAPECGYVRFSTDQQAVSDT